MQLLVFLREIVRVGDPAVDERRRGRDAPAFGDLRRRSGFAEPGTSILPGSRQRPREQRRLFGCGAEHGKGAVDLAARCAELSAISSAAQAGAIFVIRALSNSGSSAVRSRSRAADRVRRRIRRRRRCAPNSASHVAKHPVEVGPGDLPVGHASRLPLPAPPSRTPMRRRRDRHRSAPEDVDVAPRQRAGARRPARSAQLLEANFRRRGCSRCNCAASHK